MIKVLILLLALMQINNASADWKKVFEKNAKFPTDLYIFIDESNNQKKSFLDYFEKKETLIYKTRYSIYQSISVNCEKNFYTVNDTYMPNTSSFTLAKNIESFIKLRDKHFFYPGTPDDEIKKTICK